MQRTDNRNLLNLHLTSPSLLHHKRHKLINRPRPRALRAPPPQRLILQTLPHKHLRLLPQVLVDRPLESCLHELDPPVQPRRRGRVPLHPAVVGGEEQAPLLRGDFERQVALAGHSADRECVPVHAPEEVGLGVETGAQLGGVGGLFG